MDSLEATGVAIDDDNDSDRYFTEDGKMFLGSYVRKFMSEKSAIDMLGVDYDITIISPKLMEALVLKRMMPPKRPIGIDFHSYEIDAEFLEQSEFNCEIVAHMECMVDRFEWYGEAMDDTPYEWLSTDLNYDLVIRHIPLIIDEDGFKLFHAQHFYDFLGHIFKIPYSTAIFGRCDTDDKPLGF